MLSKTLTLIQNSQNSKKKKSRTSALTKGQQTSHQQSYGLPGIFISLDISNQVSLTNFMGLKNWQCFGVTTKTDCSGLVKNRFLISCPWNFQARQEERKSFSFVFGLRLVHTSISYPTKSCCVAAMHAKWRQSHIWWRAASNRKHRIIRGTLTTIKHKRSQVSASAFCYSNFLLLSEIGFTFKSTIWWYNRIRHQLVPIVATHRIYFL